MNQNSMDELDELAPLQSDRPGDRTLLRQQLSLAFLAGFSVAQEEWLKLQERSIVAAAIEQARALLKNRAASQPDRLRHAFAAGRRCMRTLHLGLPRPQGCAPQRDRPADDSLKLFVRQPFTESGRDQQALVEQVLRQIERHNGRPRPFAYLAGRQAESADSFRTSFEAETGQRFTPQGFRSHRLQRLSQADAFVNIRVGMSESSAFEIAYHVFKGACTPLLFLVWKRTPLKTTLLKELGQLCEVTYLEFEHADELGDGIAEFFHRCGGPRAAAA